MAIPGQAENLSGTELIDTLRQGGHVLLMRHASSPRKTPDTASANPDNTGLERQLDAAGRSNSTAMGNALRRRRIPIGQVFSSPTYRARETVRLAAFGQPELIPELGDGGRGMQPDSDGTRSEWLRTKLSERPSGRTNTVIVTHQPNIVGALGPQWSGIADGETLVLRAGAEEPAVIARVKIEEWPTLVDGQKAAQ